MKWLAVLLLCTTAACTRPHIEKTKCPRLDAYARRNGIPREVLAREHTQWPQYVYDYSVSHGPKLHAREKAEFTSWQVK